MQIRDRVFVVTGGGNGIGREVVLALLARGGRVAAVDVSDAGLAETARLATAAADGGLTTHRVDVTDRAAVGALPGEVAAAHGQVDGVLNVAGIAQRFARVDNLGFDEIERVVEVNFWGVVNMCKAFLPTLLQRTEASLVNVSSMGALVPVPGQSAYCVSKVAVKLLTESLYAELRGTPVAVTVVMPGGVRTEILANSGVSLDNPRAEATVERFKITSAVAAGRQIVDAVEKGTFRVRIGPDARLVDWFSRLMPQRATILIANRMRSLLDS
ncbi:SDR family NAD(P)-dependent oxidoreductase [Allorhizocola rhizosphaerae]|uniref:SDR family NAD(P)-dependent oxidoreductase n=1 Tax=Allorhizocola rhizosphaerae TaxID=1872709 RepID=UPI000E3E5898|nr:SDR family NAD(P)-dependent oxidoreductase [Allorhizocola rhizosphaerae]